MNQFSKTTWYLVPGKKRASWLRNAYPPHLGQKCHQMGRHKRFWTILRSSWGFKTPRIFLDGSRPPYLNFFNYEKSPKMRFLVGGSAPWRFRPMGGFRPMGARPMGADPWGPAPWGPHGAPRGPPRGPPIFLPYSPSWVNRCLLTLSAVAVRCKGILRSAAR